jgi:hypothetical protein
MGSREFGYVLRDGAKGKLTLKVVDEKGAPVEGAIIGGHFQMANRKGINGMSDADGLFVMKDKSRGKMHYGVRKHGYYRTSGEYIFGSHDGVVVKNGKWQPWNETRVVILKKIRNPIPMYAKTAETHLPSNTSSVGYDLMIGDWVAPHGEGKVTDFLFAITKRRVKSWSDFDGSLSVTFRAAKDGVRLRGGVGDGGSDFPWDHHAPEGEYDSLSQIGIGYVPGKGLYKSNESAACYFRVRSETNEVGELTSAYYGKISGPIKFDVRDTATGWIRFTYYLNPTPNDRNMEFDPKQNLHQGLKRFEEVRAP